MKLFRKLLLIIFILVLIAVIVCGIIGFVAYSKALDEKPLLTRTGEVTGDEHYTPFSELSQDIEDIMTMVLLILLELLELFGQTLELVNYKKVVVPLHNKLPKI